MDSLFILFTFYWGGDVVSEFLNFMQECLCVYVQLFSLYFFFWKHYLITEPQINLNYRTERKAAVFVNQHISQKSGILNLSGKKT